MDNITIRPADPDYDTDCHECGATANFVVSGKYERGCHYCGNSIALCFTHALALTVELHERLHAELRASIPTKSSAVRDLYLDVPVVDIKLGDYDSTDMRGLPSVSDPSTQNRAIDQLVSGEWEEWARTHPVAPDHAFAGLSAAEIYDKLTKDDES